MLNNLLKVTKVVVNQDSNLDFGSQILNHDKILSEGSMSTYYYILLTMETISVSDL